MNWSAVDYCDAFISCLGSYSDGTHSLQKKWHLTSVPVAQCVSSAKDCGFNSQGTHTKHV